MPAFGGMLSHVRGLEGQVPGRFQENVHAKMLGVRADTDLSGTTPEGLEPFRLLASGAQVLWFPSFGRVASKGGKSD